MTSARTGYRLTFWQAVFYLILAGGVYATWQRVANGLGGSTNLTDKFPWGLWIGFDVLCGVGLAAGGFTLVAVVHIFNIERYKPILRPAILTAFLGYLLVVLALMFDLGRPYRIWHPLIMWNPHSVMFEVGWCVTLYTTVLALEFAPMALEKLGWRKALGAVKMISVPLVILGVILSTLHQSSLGSLYLIVPNKLYPLWYTPVLPLAFFFSAVTVGLAMTIFESWHSSRALGRRLEMPLIQSLARVLAVLAAAGLMMRFMDLRHREVLHLLWVARMETYMFWLETALTAAGALLLFSRRMRQSGDAMYAAALLVIFGFVANRLNVSVTGMEAGSGAHYIPRWTEVAVTLSIVGLGFAIFRWVAQVCPVFEKPEAGDSLLPPSIQQPAEVLTQASQ